jgi:hypothetical protein
MKPNPEFLLKGSWATTVKLQWISCDKHSEGNDTLLFRTVKQQFPLDSKDSPF